MDEGWLCRMGWFLVKISTYGDGDGMEIGWRVFLIGPQAQSESITQKIDLISGRTSQAYVLLHTLVWNQCEIVSLHTP